MTAPTRHQLRRNELGEFLVKTRAAIEKHSLQIAIGLGVVIVLIVVVRLWAWSQASASDSAWGKLADVAIESGADNTDAISALRDIDTRGDTALAVAVQHRQACALIQQALFDPKQADPLLTEAAQLLTRISSDGNTPPGLAASARFALATVHETRREFDAARRSYEEISADKRLEGSPFRKLAEGRLADLDQLRQRVELLPGSPPPPAPASAPASAPTAESAPASGAAPTAVEP